MSVVTTIAGTVPGTVNVLGIKEWSMDFKMKEVNTTTFNNNFEQVINGIQSWSGSFSGNHDTDSSQTTLRNAALGGSVVGLRLHDGSGAWSGTAYLNGMGRKIAADGKSEGTYNFVGTGTINYA